MCSRTYEAHILNPSFLSAGRNRISWACSYMYGYMMLSLLHTSVLARLYIGTTFLVSHGRTEGQRFESHVSQVLRKLLSKKT